MRIGRELRKGYTLLAFVGGIHRNVILAKQQNYEMFITAENWNGSSWDWGHYITNEKEALQDFLERAQRNSQYYDFSPAEWDLPF